MDVIPNSDIVPGDDWDVKIDDSGSCFYDGYRWVGQTKIRIPNKFLGNSMVFSFWRTGDVKYEWASILDYEETIHD